MQWTVIVILIFALFVGIFAVQNDVDVVLKFFSYQVETSLVVVALGAMALGGLMLGILGLISQIKIRFQIRSLKLKIKNLEKELNRFKTNENKEDDIDKRDSVESLLDNNIEAQGFFPDIQEGPSPEVENVEDKT